MLFDPFSMLYISFPAPSASLGIDLAIFPYARGIFPYARGIFPYALWIFPYALSVCSLAEGVKID